MKANKFDQLSPEDQHHIIDLCNHNTYPKVVEILAQPRPEGLALNTSVSALCRFYTSWNPLNQQAKLMEQLGKSLRVCRQATPLASLTGVLAILENNVLKQLSDGKPATDLEKEINLMTRVHRSFISEETLNHKRGQFDSRRDYFKHVENISGEHDYDFARNDLPEKPVGYPEPDTFSSEDQDIEDIADFFQYQVPQLHVPLNAETYKRHIENKHPLPHIQLLQAAQAVRQQNCRSRGEETHSSSPEAASGSTTQSNTETAASWGTDSLVRGNAPSPSTASAAPGSDPILTFPNPVTDIVNSLYDAENSGKIPSKPHAIPQIPPFSQTKDFTAPDLLRALNSVPPNTRARP